MIPLTSLAMRVAFARELSGLTPRGLSVIAGLDPTHVRLIETGERPKLYGETLVMLARALGTTAEWLITGDGNPPTRDEVLAGVERARAAQSLPATGTSG